jgi:hypothetical protein
MKAYPRSCVKWAMRGALSAGLLLLMAIWSGCERHEFPKSATGETNPPVTTLARLEVSQIVSVPFRVRFMAADFDPKKTGPTTVQMQMVDLGQKTYFVSAGETIPGTSFRLESYSPKQIVRPDGAVQDVSEITVSNTKSGVKGTLPKGQLVNFMEFYTVLRDTGAPGAKAGPDIVKFAGGYFSLPSDPERKFDYKVIAVKVLTMDTQARVREGEVTIETPSGEKVVKAYRAKKEE